MEFKLCLLVGTILWLSLVQHVASSTEALLECGRVHQIDNIANLSTATASYSNSQCMLVCVIGSAIFIVDSIHEGRSCPEDTNGICRAGQCIGGQEDALRECGLRHSVDFHKLANHQGTAFTNDQCALRCVLGGIELPVSLMHEGEPCPANRNGICRSGSCVSQSTNPGSTVTPILPTTAKQPITITTVPPTTVTKPSINLLFSPSKMKLLNISLESTPSLHDHQKINLYFFGSKHGNSMEIGDFYASPLTSIFNYLKNINDIPSKLNKDSCLSIQLECNGVLSIAQEDVYPLFEAFYQSHKLAFGEKENFVTIFPKIFGSSLGSTVMDVTLRFTIVFSKD